MNLTMELVSFYIENFLKLSHIRTNVNKIISSNIRIYSWLRVTKNTVCLKNSSEISLTYVGENAYITNKFGAMNGTKYATYTNLKIRKKASADILITDNDRQLRIISRQLPTTNQNQSVYKYKTILILLF